MAELNVCIFAGRSRRNQEYTDIGLPPGAIHVIALTTLAATVHSLAYMDIRAKKLLRSGTRLCPPPMLRRWRGVRTAK